MTLEEVLKSVGGYVDQDASYPTGTDLSTRLNYVNRALREWSDHYDWNEMNKTTGWTPSLASTVSLSLPANFKKPMSPLFYYNGNPEPEVYVLIDKNFRSNYDNTDKVAYIDGDYASGLTLVVPSGLPSGASLVMDIQVYPSSMASPADILPMSIPEFVVNRAIQYVLETRSDERFPFLRSDADRALARMVEGQNSKNLGNEGTIPVIGTGYVMGR